MSYKMCESEVIRFEFNFLEFKTVLLHIFTYSEILFVGRYQRKKKLVFNKNQQYMRIYKINNYLK